MITTKKEDMKSVYGVPEITQGFVKNIQEICFKQIKGITVRDNEFAR